MIQWCKSENGVDEMAPSRYELTDEQWKQIEGFFPPYTTGRPSKRSNREMFNAML